MLICIRSALIFYFVLLCCAAPALGWTGQVVAVHDGDSVRVQRPDGHVVKIRIYGVDCPELGQPWGREARQLTTDLLMGRMVDVVPTGQRPSHGREVAGIVLLDQMVVLQDALISAGLAWVDARYCKLAVCDLWRQHQFDAASANPPRGLWADPAPMPPWQWRKQKRRAD